MGLFKKAWKWVTDKAQEATFGDLAKTGIAALSSYGAYKDQKKKNEMQQAAYDDYMAQAAAAGFEAEAAVDLNLTPMTVSGVPTTKADVTDFTAVAARGGLMTLPQRKRYAYGPELEDIEVMDEETITPFGLQQETGIDLTGEQVFHDTGDPRTNAQNVWTSGAIDQNLYEMDFEIFFQSGDWADHISQAPAPTGDMQMASHEGNDAFLENRYQELLEMNLSPAEAAAQAEKELSSGDVPGPMAAGGIIGLRNGGRPGYWNGTTPEEGDIGLEEQIIHPGTLDEGDIGMPGQATTEFEHEGSLATEPTSLEEVIEIAKRVPRAGNPYFIWETMKKAGATFAEAIEIVKNKFGGEEVIEDSERFLPDWKSEARGIEYLRHGGRPGYAFGPGPVVDQETMAQSITLPDGGEEVVTDSMTETAGGGARGWKAQMLAEDLAEERYGKEFYDLTQNQQFEIYNIALDMIDSGGNAKGGLPKRVRKAPGGIMDLGGLEKDYRTTGGFVPLGGRERADDVPARLSKNEFVMTADAVRAAGGGSINKGAQRMYDTMKHLEASPQSKRMTA